MEHQSLIRCYEQLKKQRHETVLDALALEKEWIHLSKEMERESKKLKKKTKEELVHFSKKSLANAKELGAIVFETFVPHPKEPLHSLIQVNSNLYKAKGIKGIFHVYEQRDENVKSFKQNVKEIREQEKLRNITKEEWKCRVEELKHAKATYYTETEWMTLFAWWDVFNKNGQDLNKTFLLPVYSNLCCYTDGLMLSLAKEKGYPETIIDLLHQKKYMKIIRRKGLRAFFTAVKGTEDEKMIISELTKRIDLPHPKDAYPLTRQMKRHFILHAGPTNSGKTYHAIQALKKAKSGAYLSPIRLLAFEIQEKLLKQQISCHLITGEEEIIMPGAKHRSSTIEMADFSQTYDTVVIDEMQFIADQERGHRWLQAIVGMKANEIHLCGSENAISFILQLIRECGDTYEVFYYERNIPLVVEKEPFLFPQSIQKGDALIAFNKETLYDIAQTAERNGLKVSLLYGKLPSDTRRKQMELFANGTTDIVVATDAIGIGLNLPIRRVVFMETEKWSNGKMRPLTSQEIKQIAGRAGRKGMYDQGLVNSLTDKSRIEEALLKEEGDITTSVIAPTPALLKLSFGTIRQRLDAWKKADIHVPYLQKADISEMMYLLEQIEEWENELSLSDVFKAIHIPFYARNKQLLLLWMSYMRKVKDGNLIFEKPLFCGNSLLEKEMYYQKLSLYFQMSNKFRFAMDQDWVKKERKNTSFDINTMIQTA